MKAIRLIPAATAALLLVAGGAQAQTPSPRPNLNTVQYNLANIRAELNAVVEDVNGDVNATAAAIGNSLTIDGGTAGNISNYQFFRGDAQSLLNSTVTDVVGDVTLTSAAIANSASITTENGAGWIS
ncbi:MAG: hypothetical protein ACK5WW_07100, partial [Brevundimonas sp.]